jgi:hypothetical protein
LLTWPVIFLKKGHFFKGGVAMKFFILLFTVLGCLELAGMQLTEAEQVALLAEEIFEDYQQHIEKQESAFRTEVMRLYVNSEKERRLKAGNPIQAFYDEYAERILERMAGLSVDMPDERINQIMASVAFYFENQCCHNCSKRKWEGTGKQLHSNIIKSHLCFNCKKTNSTFKKELINALQSRKKNQN